MSSTVPAPAPRVQTHAGRRSYFLGKLLLTVCAAAAPLLVLHGVLLLRQKAADEDAAVLTLRTRVARARLSLDTAFTRIDGMLQFLAARPELQALDGPGCGQLIAGIATVDPLLANIGAVDLDGNLLCLSARPQAPKRNYRDAPWFAGAEAATAQGRHHLSRPYMGDVSRKLMINVVAPLRDPAGRRIGMLAAAIDLQRLALGPLGTEGMPEGSVVALLDGEGRVLGRDPLLPDLGERRLPARVQEASLQARDGTFRQVSNAGVASTYAFTDLAHHGLRVGALTPDHEVAARSEQAFRRSALALLLVAGCGLAAAVWAARRLSAPLQSLAASARAQAGGATDVRADEGLPGEFGTLAAEFNAMLDARNAGEASRRAQAAAEAASQAKSTFLAHMSHEIRTPMNAILGLADLTLRTELSPRQRGYLDKLKIAADTLLELIDRVLDFSRLEAGKLELVPAPFVLYELLGRIGAMVGEAAQRQGLALQFVVAPEVPQRLVGDGPRLGQVLLNLCSNAIKFTEAGAVVVRVDCVRAEPSSAQLRFSVTDSGIGLSADEIARLFQPFVQADASTARRYGGTGLGLVISRQLVEAMGGTIEVASTPGRGSTFCFSLRLEREHVEPSSTPEASGASGDAGAGAAAVAALRGRRVLLVEDNDVSRLVAAELLVEVAGMQVTMAATGEEALQALDAGGIDVVLMDVQLATMDGCETARRIRAQARHARLPIIAVTAHTLALDRERCLAAGMDDCLGKPFEPARLLQTLARQLARGPVRTLDS
ncbi:ATP-binding protein [Aquabacterium humicola]|uniref:ATP-binding protein n=1 Tax=Aquabacterium humicola TaxID=3237377 RepID=UPI002542A865|nr:ATP-binding protein [Rubrivivax pictus]